MNKHSLTARRSWVWCQTGAILCGLYIVVCVFSMCLRGFPLGNSSKSLKMCISMSAVWRMNDLSKVYLVFDQYQHKVLEDVVFWCYCVKNWTKQTKKSKLVDIGSYPHLLLLRLDKSTISQNVEKCNSTDVYSHSNSNHRRERRWGRADKSREERGKGKKSFLQLCTLCCHVVAL